LIWSFFCVTNTVLAPRKERSQIKHNNREWKVERLGQYPEEFLGNLPIACHGCERAFLIAPDLPEPSDLPDIEVDFLDLGLLCPLLPPAMMEGLRYQTKTKQLPTRRYTYPRVAEQPRLLHVPQRSQAGQSQLQLFRSAVEGEWSEWREDTVLPRWICNSENVNGYLAELTDANPGDEQKFLTRIKTDPDGCRWFEWFVPAGK